MIRFKILFFLITVFSLLTSTLAFSATADVSQPAKLTDSDYYERGRSIVLFDGSDHWLFYGLSANCKDTCSSSNPDLNDYEIYFKKSDPVAGLAAATERKVTVIHNNNIFMCEGEDYGYLNLEFSS